MPRCLALAWVALTLAAPLLASAQTVTETATQQVPQLQRPLPLKSLRGELQFGHPPEALLNGVLVRLAPGARIKNTQNLLVMSGALMGQKLMANYTIDPYGLLMDVWLLGPQDLAKPWPQTTEQAATWSYDPVTQTWIKP